METSSPPNRGDSTEQLAGGEEVDNYVNLPPGRIHATRGPTRLQSSWSQNERSRSRSPHTSKKTISTSTLTDGNSSISSLEDVDQDILTDRHGLDQLDSSGKHLHNSREFNNFLTPVNERASDDILEDCHAFSDVVYSSNASRVSVGTGTDAFLDPLVEGEEETEMLDDIDEEGGEDQFNTVILTNMENLNLESGRAGFGGGTSTAPGSLVARDGTSTAAGSGTARGDGTRDGTRTESST